MDKKLILVGAPPACGKNYVSELICKALKGVAYFDKDNLASLLHCCFKLCNKELDMDGEFYLKNLRHAEYDTLFKLAFSALGFENFVLVNAPFIKEVRDVEYMRGLKKRANDCGAQLVVIWVTAPVEICYQRMKERNSNRDILKLAKWKEYEKNLDFSAPIALKKLNAIDNLFVFDNTNESTALESLSQIIVELGE